MTAPDLPQVPQQPAPVSPPFAPASLPPAAPRRRRWIWIAAAALVVVVTVPTITLFATRASAEDQAIEFCQDQVLDKLKSPATAKFSGATVAHDEGTSVYRVEGVVDAQNGFGALVRSSFDCILDLGDDGTWASNMVDIN